MTENLFSHNEGYSGFKIQEEREKGRLETINVQLNDLIGELSNIRNEYFKAHERGQEITAEEELSVKQKIAVLEQLIEEWQAFGQEEVKKINYFRQEDEHAKQILYDDLHLKNADAPAEKKQQ